MNDFSNPRSMYYITYQYVLENYVEKRYDSNFQFIYLINHLYNYIICAKIYTKTELEYVSDEKFPRLLWNLKDITYDRSIFSSSNPQFKEIILKFIEIADRRLNNGIDECDNDEDCCNSDYDENDFTKNHEMNIELRIKIDELKTHITSL